ncbi:MAG: hypothetical protein H0V81_15340 [Solirubrobacterales bacterium]|nr:hypothetical protein [Solirubrobacterales bacterium]
MTDQLFSDFIDAWNTGRRPELDDYLAQVADPTARRELAGQIADWIDIAPTPAYSEAVRAEIRATPAVARVLAAAGEPGGLWPELLPELRARSSLSLTALATRVRERFSLGEAEQKRTVDFLTQMESGELEPAGVSRRLLDALGELFDTSAERLADAGMFGRGLNPAVAGGAHLFRADGDAGGAMAADLSVLSEAAHAPAPPPLDEVERLFLGGPAG